MADLKKAALGALTATAIVMGLAGNSMAGPVKFDPLGNPSVASQGALDQGRVTLVGNKESRHFRDQRNDAINKHNPNAAAISQMLGGAKSIDLAGQGMAGVSPRHYAWCFLKYGSYRIRDNSFVDFSGQRAQCSSPYQSGEN